MAQADPVIDAESEDGDDMLGGEAMDMPGAEAMAEDDDEDDVDDEPWGFESSTAAVTVTAVDGHWDGPPTSGLQAAGRVHSGVVELD